MCIAWKYKTARSEAAAPTAMACDRPGHTRFDRSHPSDAHGDSIKRYPSHIYSVAVHGLHQFTEREPRADLRRVKRLFIHGLGRTTSDHSHRHRRRSPETQCLMHCANCTDKRTHMMLQNHIIPSQYTKIPCTCTYTIRNKGTRRASSETRMTCSYCTWLS